MTARAIRYPKDNATGTRYWGTVEDRLKAAGVTAAQVQAVWMKQADAGPREGFPAYAETLCDEMEDITRIVGERFPNARLMYLSSRTYGGYATTGLNPESYAFESGFAVRWLIQRQLDGKGGLNFDPAKGPVRVPWLSWGPYLWANGTTKNANGLTYDREDFAPDGTHPAPPGQQKVAAEMQRFFRTDPTTGVRDLLRPVFLLRPLPCRGVEGVRPGEYLFSRQWRQILRVADAAVKTQELRERRSTRQPALPDPQGRVHGQPRLAVRAEDAAGLRLAVRPSAGAAVVSARPAENLRDGKGRQPLAVAHAPSGRQEAGG